MSDRDSFVDEVTDELRRDRLMGRLKGLVGVIAVVAVIAVGAVAWLEWSASRNEATAGANGARLAAALEESGAARATALDEASDPVSRMARADALAGAGSLEQARAAYDALASEADPLYADMARYKLALISEGETRAALLNAIIAPDRPYRLLGLEQRAIDAAEAGDTDRARADLEALMAAQSVPNDLRQRVQELQRAFGAPTDEGEAQ